MKQITYTIKDELGIHARPAGLLVNEAKKFKPTAITISKGGDPVDLTKLMKLMSLGVKNGETVTITADGEQEDAAIAAVEKFMNENL